MSTLVSINFHTIGCKKNDQKRGAKSHENPEELREQRIVYEKFLRKDKRAKVLEERRRVLEKLNWTVAWSDDEDDDDDKAILPPEEIVKTLIHLESSIQPMKPDVIAISTINVLEANVSHLSWTLDVCRRSLRKEVAMSVEETAQCCKPQPGPLASALSSEETLSVLIRLLVKSSSHDLLSGFDLSITREASAILSDLTIFEHFTDRICNLGIGPHLVKCLQKILNDNQLDLVCFLNAFNTLDNILSRKGLGDASPRVLCEQILIHLSRALTVYGPDEKVTNLYIKSITSLLTSIIKFVHRQKDFIEESFTSVFNQILNIFQSLFNLNDPEVTCNVLSVIVHVSKTVKGLELLLSHQNILQFTQSITEAPIEYSSESKHITKLGSAYEILANFMQASPVICQHFVSIEFFKRAYEAVKIDDLDIGYNIGRILLMVTQFDSRVVHLYFECKLIEYFGSIFFCADNRTQSVFLDICYEIAKASNLDDTRIFLEHNLISSIESQITLDDHNTNHKVLEITRLIVKKAIEGNFLEDHVLALSSMKAHLEKLMHSSNPTIVNDAVELLDNYFDPPRALNRSPSTRIH